MHALRRDPPRPGPGFDVYWEFAAERQRVYRNRLQGLTGPSLTDDPVLSTFRFTNAYRASDRVSQYLTAQVIYNEPRDSLNTFPRLLIFKVFNRIDTWEYLTTSVGEIGVESLLSGELDEALAALPPKRTVYNAAYIMPPPRDRTGAKFRRHLSLLRHMVLDSAHLRIQAATSMEAAFGILVSYESIGPFLAYQFLIDLNYTEHLTFSEGDHVVAGPGALRGIRKCFTATGDYSPSEIIRWVTEQQDEAFRLRELEWSDLWGRPLQLIDVQNLFCEVDKYTREARPDLSAFAPGSRIKQRYTPATGALSAWFPPKWGVNDSVPTRYWPEAVHGEVGHHARFGSSMDDDCLGVKVDFDSAAASVA